jgi:hypothetical protein
MTGKTTWIIGLILLGGIFFPAAPAAQEVPSGLWRDFGSVGRSDAWLLSDNAAGLVCLPDSVQKISIAEIFANKNGGQFIDYHQSDNSLTFGAQTASFFRINSEIVLYGKINYENFTGQNMGGSAFIYPEYNTINITEISGSTKGKKNKEQYNLIGAAGIRLTDYLSFGVKVDYTTANYSKYKDLRHINKYLDLKIIAGFAYNLTNNIELGASYAHRRSIESLRFGIYGNSDQLFSPLVNFGAFYGRTELLSGSSSSTEQGYAKGTNPMFNRFNGASVQINLKTGGNLKFFNEFSFFLRNGYYGDKSSTSLAFTKHDGTVMTYSGTFSFVEKQNEHFLKINLSSDHLNNHENIYTIQNTSGGKKEIIYHGSTKILDKTLLNADLEYTGQINVRDYNPEWILKAGAAFAGRDQTVSIYPYFRKQDIYRWNVYLCADKRITVRKNQFGLALGLLYGSGGGEANEDGLYATPSDDNHRPFSSDYNLLREHEYLTASRVKGNAGLYYSRVLNNYVTGYTRLEYELTNAFQVENLDGNRFNSVYLSVGCKF